VEASSVEGVRWAPDFVSLLLVIIVVPAAFFLAVQETTWRVSDREASPLRGSELGMKTEEAFGGGLERPVEEEGPERWGGEGEGWQLPGLQRHLPGEWGTLMGHVTSRRICVDLLGQPKKPNWANGSLVNSSRRCLLARIFQIQTKGIIY
jgi:hypothetical protein